MAATSCGDFICLRPLMVARTRLIGLREPLHLARTSCTPTASNTARIAPPAITPVPLEAGVIAGGAMRAVFEAVGVHDVLAKCNGSRNPINLVRATISGLKHMKSPQEVAAKRGKTVEDITG